jgi:tetratricopeptide (TPR) repeat protein
MRMIAMRLEADRLAAAGERRQAYALYRELAAYWTGRDDVLAVRGWTNAARQLASLEERVGQVEAARRAVELLPPWSDWHTGLTREVGLEAYFLLADGLHWLDRAAEAETAARTGIRAAVAFGDREAEMTCTGVLGHALLRLGRPEETLGCQRRILELCREIGVPMLVVAALNDLGVALVQLNQLDEAAETIQEALSLLDDAGDAPWAPGVRIGPLTTLALVRRRQGLPAEAVTLAEEAMELSLRQSSREQYLMARMAWATAVVASGTAPGGREALLEVFDELLARGAGHLAGRAAGTLASALLAAGRADEAQEWADRAVELSSTGDVDARGWARSIAAQVAIARGDLAAGSAALLTGLDDLEQVRGGITDDRQNVAVLDTQEQLYRALQWCRLAAGDDEGALLAAERARGRSLLRGLARKGVAAQVTPFVEAPSTDQLRRLCTEQEVGFLVLNLVPALRAPDGDGDVLPVHDASGLHTWFIDADRVAHAVVDRVALRSLEDATTGDGPSPSGWSLRDVLVPPPVPVAGDGDGTEDGDDGDDGAPDEAALDVLSALLVHPLDGALAGTRARRIVVVADGELDRIPYAALRLRSGVHLADRWPVTLVPALGVFAELVTRPVAAGHPEEPLLVGDPLPVQAPPSPQERVPALPRLAHAAREVATVAAWYPGVSPLLDAAATRDRVLQRLATCEVAHFATHGLAATGGRGTPGALCLSPGGGDPGYLRADDIAELHLPRCRVAVLSACRTGWGRSSYEGTLGLARAFLAAGVPSVVVSLWAVDDEGTADLMIDLHRRLRDGVDLGEALRASAVAARDAGRPVQLWAPFTCVGDLRTRLA